MAYDPRIDHLAVVTAARAKFDHLPPGAERSWRTVNETAWQLQRLGETDAGLHRKGGTNYNGYSIDIVGYRDSGQLIDALQSADTVAVPQWFEVPGVLNWAPPVPTEPPEPPTVRWCCEGCRRTYDEHGWALGVIMDDLRQIKAKLGI